MRRRIVKKKKNTKFRVFLYILIFICIGVLLKQEYEIYQIKQERDATIERIDKLTKTKNSLEQEKKNLADPAYIEKLARDEYNMVKKNEVPVFIVDEDTKK